MAGYRLDVPWQFAYTTAALTRTGAKLTVYENETTTPVALFSDRACLVAADNPIVSVNGYFPVRFVASPALHTLLWEDTDGTDRLSGDDIAPFQDAMQANAYNQALDPTLTAFAALTISADKGFRGTGADTFATFDLTAAGLALLDDADAAAQRTTLSALGTGDVASAANIRANTANKLVDTDSAWDSVDDVTVTYAASVAFDLSTFINAIITLTGNITFDAPTNGKTHQSGCVEIVQDASGSRVATWNAAWVFAGGNDPVLSTTANARDLLFYRVLASGSVFASLIKDVKN